MTYAIGLDIADLTFTASCVTPYFAVCFGGCTFPQSPEGWERLLTLCQEHAIAKATALVVMEATGVYSERISYYLSQQGFAVYVEPPGKIHKAFYERGKTDPLDSRQIAEYGFRYRDQLHPWRPKTVTVDQLQTLLTVREQLTGMRTACKNVLHSLSRKHYPSETAKQVYTDLKDDLKDKIADIDVRMQTLIDGDAYLSSTITQVASITHVGFLLAVNLLVVTDGFANHLNHAQLAAYLGICPFEHQSGTSIMRRPRSDGAGPARLRKLIYLAAMRLRQNNPDFKRYFERKVAEGKSKRLILNNISNHALKLICGVIRSGKPYIKNYRSIRPES